MRNTRSYTVDRSCATQREKSLRIDIGLELLQRYRQQGVRFTQEEIAVWCGCTVSAIYLIEQRALKRLRNRLLFSSDPFVRELAHHMDLTRA